MTTDDNALFQTVMLDCPWPERGGGKIKRGADRHYDLITTQHEMLRTVVQAEPWNRVAPVAHGYFWVTNNYLEWGTWLMHALGFRYITNVVWVKQRPGLGQYFRGKHELLLFGVRGEGAAQLRTPRKDLVSVIVADRGKHSKKPDEAYDLIEARSQGPFLEMFARSSRPLWTPWGNEAPDAEDDNGGDE